MVLTVLERLAELVLLPLLGLDTVLVGADTLDDENLNTMM